jgi:signal transduction histidine kinase
MESKMETYQIILADKNPQSLHNGRKNSQSESQKPTLDENILNMLRIMSHDIRGSIVSISATLKLLSRGYYGKMDERVADNLKDLLSKTIGLIGLTEEYLGRTFSVNDDLETLAETWDLRRDIINPVLEELDAEIKAREIQIENGLSTISINPILIKGNKIWLKIVFRNLLKNAMKYGDKGGTITIGFENHGSYGRFNVFNSGKPIPEEYRDKLFTKFMRLGNNGYAKERVDGMGLGLYLIKTIIQKHGGEMWYEAREDGSNFVFTLPIGDSPLGVRSV